MPVAKPTLVTPEMAAEWLLLNDPDNRPMEPRTVNGYARDMAAGKWVLTHEGIAFGTNGLLIDGQHTLSAIVSAGVPVWIMVTRGVDAGIRAPINTGRGRTLAYILDRHHKWIAVVTYLDRLENGMLASRSARPSPALIEETYGHSPELIDEYTSAFKKFPAGVVSAAVYSSPVDPRRVWDFMVQCRDGENLQRGDPAFAWRSRFSSGFKRFGQNETALVTFAAIMAVLRGQPLAHVAGSLKAYQAITGKRRDLRVPHTPTTDKVSQ